MLRNDPFLFAKTAEASEIVARPVTQRGMKASPQNASIAKQSPNNQKPSVENILPLTNPSQKAASIPSVPLGTVRNNVPQAVAPGAEINGDYTPTQQEIDASNGINVGHLPLTQDWEDTKRHASDTLESAKSGVKSFVEGLGNHTLAHLREANKITQRPNDLLSARPWPLTGAIN